MTAGHTARQVVRDHRWIDREYNGEKYPRLRDAARAALARGDRRLSSVFGAVFRAERGMIETLGERRFVVGAKELALPVPFGQSGILGFINHILGEACTEQTHAVIELGAGWGRNLWAGALSGMIHERTQLWALEYAPAGRETADLLAHCDPTLPFRTLAYDYHAPDYAALEPSRRPCVLLTVHSVEQIPMIRRDVFTGLFERLPVLAGLHLEPVGWQIPHSRSGSRRRVSSAAYAERHDYNRNLWDVLEGLERDGLIEITQVAADIMGMNLENPSSFIAWRTRA